MRKALPFWVALALLVVAGAAGAEEPCRHSAPRNVNLDGAALKSLLLNLGSTDAHVRGVAGLSGIEVRGTACASNPQWLDELKIDTSRNGPEATVSVRTGNHNDAFNLFGFSRYAYMRLTVNVPLQLAVVLNSGSGDVVAESLASLDFHSGSGDLRAYQIAGALTLDLGSGDVEARGVGSVDLRSTGSGDVSVSNVRGDVRAGHAGSGDLHFSGVQGGVSVGTVGSGDVRLENIGGSIEVDRIGSGDLVVDDVAGSLQVDEDGSGDVSYHGVKGTVHLPGKGD
ncbi:MAG TPA: DUF4097 family beta strand repeat-containing protein [Steroidobacteraceae bacterium]|nr:DUF4097 family beta strand repeat-containing protein [Steroidobacteraceae bacterium]